MDQPFVPMKVQCPNCKEKQSVSFAVRLGAYVGGPETITCVKCERDFDVEGPGKILAGPFAFPPGFENLQG
jgi:transcription elongation factor Elf1